MRVRIPTPLRSYTSEQKEVTCAGSTVAEVLADLEQQFPGIRWRMVDERGQLRTHMKIFVNLDAIRDLDTPLAETDEVTIMQALSGG